MSHPSLDMLVAAEVRKLASRVSVRLSLAVLAAVAIAVPLLYLMVSTSLARSDAVAEAGGATLTLFDATTPVATVHTVRDFFLFRAMLIAVVAVSVAGEFVARTLREDLVRPVSRGAVLTAKLLALYVFVIAGTVVPLVLAVPVSIAAFGVTGPFVDRLVPWGLALLGDLGFCTLVVAIAVGVRSVPGTIGGVFVYWIADRVLGLALWGAETARAMLEPLLKGRGLDDLMPLLDALIQARPWLPSAAFNLDWDYSATDGVVWQSVAALGIYTVASYAVAVALLTRVDVD